MAKEKLIGVHWKARSYLNDVEFLDKDVEGTYFRLIQFVYLTQDRLKDEDEKLWQRCKCTSVRQYRMHKAELMKPRGIDPATGEVLSPRVVVEVGVEQGSEVGFLRIPKCSEQLGTASRLRHAKSKAGKASAEGRKAQKTKETGSTTVATEQATQGGTYRVQKDQQNGQRNGASVAPTLKEVLTEPLSLVPHEHRGGAGSGSLDARPDRPPIPTAAPNADPEHVEVTMPTGALIRISRTHQVDEVWTPRDCPDTLLTRAEAKALRAAAIASGTQPYLAPTTEPAEPPSAQSPVPPMDHAVSASMAPGMGDPLGPNPLREITLRSAAARERPPDRPVEAR